ncbi:MAG: prepilin-type N-terminal cleavage/methylation domain-containing protein [Candidatus Gastranaerophilaceae bacterium]
MFKIKKGFTLAEMMVVMLILSIVLAAMAPVMTTRNKTDQTSPWRYSEGNLSDAYYGLGESQTAMIGQRQSRILTKPLS